MKRMNLGTPESPQNSGPSVIQLPMMSSQDSSSKKMTPQDLIQMVQAEIHRLEQRLTEMRKAERYMSLYSGTTTAVLRFPGYTQSAS